MGRRSARIPLRRCLGALAAMMIVAAGCGPQHSEEEFLRANAELLSRSGGGTNQTSAGPIGAGADTTGALPADSAAPAATIGDPSTTGATPGGDPGAASGVAVGTQAGTSSGSRASGGPTSGANPAGTQSSPAGSRAATPSGGQSPAVPGPATPGAPQAASGPKSEIRLGSVGTDTGPAGIAFISILYGARAWVSDINARGGLNGHPVKLLVADDGGDPSKALANVKRMVEVDKVHAFYATRDFLTGQAYMPYLEEKKIPAITTCACNPVDGPSPMTFDPYLVAGGEGGVWMHVGPLLTLSEKRKVALMYCREAPICVVIRNNMKKVEKALGITIVWEGQNSIAQPDYTAELLSARNSGADSIVSINDNDTNIRILRDKRRLAWDVPYSTQFSNHDDRFLKFAGADAEGILLSGSIANYDTSPKMADFRAAMAKYQPGLGASDFAAGAWSSGKMLEKIAGRFGSDVTTNDILEGLYSLNKETLDGRIAATTYPRDKPHDRVNLCIIPLTIKSGKFIPKNGDEFFCEPGWQPA